jgi:hypothetical protein
LWRRGKMLRASHTRAQAGPIRRRGQGWWRPQAHHLFPLPFP